tara:strand:- start:750 stop:1079 length:330 start_codon:yes stop_codon:yes gene_type:complete
MKTENKIFRLAVLAVGFVVYWFFFAAYWDSDWKGFYLVDVIDFKYSFVSNLIYFVVRDTPLDEVLWHIKFDHGSVEDILLVIVNVGYFYCLWFYREDIVVLIKDFIKKI